MTACGTAVVCIILMTWRPESVVNKNRVEEERDHGLDDPDSRRDLHRPGNQRLSAGRVLIRTSFLQTP